jgi:transposase
VKEKRKRFDKSFKVEAVKMVVEQGFTREEVGRQLGIHGTTIGNWIKRFQEDGKEAFPGNGRLKPADEELRRLKEENKRLRMERDFLKKTAAFFAREQK